MLSSSWIGGHSGLGNGFSADFRRKGLDMLNPPPMAEQRTQCAGPTAGPSTARPAFASPVGCALGSTVTFHPRPSQKSITPGWPASAARCSQVKCSPSLPVPGARSSSADRVDVPSRMRLAHRGVLVVERFHHVSTGIES